MAKIRIQVDEQASREATKLLEQIDALVRGPAINATLRTMGIAVKNDVMATLPKPGYPGDKEEYTPLRDTLQVRVKNYNQGDKIVKVLVVGYRWPEGAQGQPLESGHKIANQYGEHEGFVAEQPFLADSVKRLQPSQANLMIEGARKMLARAKARGSA